MTKPPDWQDRRKKRLEELKRRWRDKMPSLIDQFLVMGARLAWKRSMQRWYAQRALKRVGHN